MTPVFPARRIFLMSNLLTADIIEALSAGPGKTLVVGVGNTLRRDDGIGPYITGRLNPGARLQVIDAGFAPENIIEEAVEAAPEKILIIDAADFRGRGGEVRIIEKEHIPETTVSTHSIPLNVISELIAERLSCRITFIGIQPVSVVMGEGLSEAVRESADCIIRVLTENFSGAAS